MSRWPRGSVFSNRCGVVRKARLDGLPILLLAYAAASLFHHIHNAEYLTEYPGMPDWLSPANMA